MPTAEGRTAPPCGLRAASVVALALIVASCGGGPGDRADAGRDGDRNDGYTAAMAAEHAADEPDPAPGARVDPKQPVITEEVEYRDGPDATTGYLATPRGGGPWPGVVVIHEWWGLNDNVRTMTRRLAGEGYAALAVDLYGGSVATESSEARGLMEQAMGRGEENLANVSAGRRYLTETVGSDRTAVLGWCFGGTWALRSALEVPDLDAAVVFYGQPVTDREALRELDTPVLGLFGGQDGGIPVSDARRMQRVASEVGADVETVVYEDAGHAFANPSGSNWQPDAADDAWERTLAFLGKHLGSGGGDGSG